MPVTPPVGRESAFMHFSFTWSPSSRREVEISGISKLRLLGASEMPPPLRSPSGRLRVFTRSHASLCPAVFVNPSSPASKGFSGELGSRQLSDIPVTLMEWKAKLQDKRRARLVLPALRTCYPFWPQPCLLLCTFMDSGSRCLAGKQGHNLCPHLTSGLPEVPVSRAAELDSECSHRSSDLWSAL